MLIDQESLASWFNKIVEQAYDIIQDNHRLVGTSFDERLSEMEGITRPLWGVAFLHKAGYGLDINYHDINKKIIAGMDTESLDYWGDMKNYGHQATEMTPIALYLYYCRDISWDVFSDIEKEKIIKWISEINNCDISQNNWLFFRILTNTCLYKMGIGIHPEISCKKDFETIEKMYLGNGWYSDGISEQMDYYIAFAMQYYSLLYIMLIDDPNSHICIRYKERAELFSESYIHFFSSGGSEIPFGRSLIYRFAHVSFWCIAMAMKIKMRFSIGEVKGIIFRNLRWWSDQSVYQMEGLPLGYVYPNSILTEAYNGVSSSYWCLKSAVVLLSNKEFWNTSEAAFPKIDTLYPIPEARMLLTHDKNDYSHSILYMNGQSSANNILNCAAKYGKFAYSNIFGFSVARTNYGMKACASDNMLAVVLENNVYVRHRVEQHKQCDGYLYSRWSPMKGIIVDSYIVPNNPWHIRIHQVKSKHICELYDCGFSIDSEGCIEKHDDMIDILSTKQLQSCARLLFGKGKCLSVENDPNTNIIFPRTKMPCIRFRCSPGYFTIIDYFAAGFTDENIDFLCNIEVGLKTVTIRLDDNEIKVKCKKIIAHNNEKLYQIRYLIKKLRRIPQKVLELLIQKVRRYY